MAIKSYILTADCKSPFVRATGIPHRPQEVQFKNFRKGEIVRGEMKHANNKPAFVLVGGALVVPLSCLKEVVTKDITSSASGETSGTVEKKKIELPPMSKAKYIDAIVLGTLIGIGGVYLAEKQGWIAVVDKKNKIYGGAIGALAGTYLFYRYKTLKETSKPKEKE